MSMEQRGGFMVSSVPPYPPPGNAIPDFNAADCRRWSVHTIAEVSPLTEEFAAELRRAGFDDKDVFGLRLAVEEAVINGIRHGNEGDPRKQVRIHYRVSSEQVLLLIEDEGQGFKPDDLPDPRSDECLERPCGRGVFLMRFYMTWVQYSERGNSVLMCKKKS
jgi:serine/threonine-protein kinase RsbW